MAEVAHGPKGGCVPEELRDIRVVNNLMETPDEKGDKTVTFPSWFHRVGVRTAEIDTGLGPVLIKAASFTETELDGAAGFTKILRSVVKLPEWVAEYDIDIPVKKNPNLTVPAGEEIPSIDMMLAYGDHAANQMYVEECWPPSLVQQIMAAQYYLRLPPIAAIRPPTED